FPPCKRTSPANRRTPAQQMPVIALNAADLARVGRGEQRLATAGASKKKRRYASAVPPRISDVVASKTKTPRLSEVHSETNSVGASQHVEERAVDAARAERVVSRERRILVEQVGDRREHLRSLRAAGTEVVRARQVESLMARHIAVADASAQS